MTYLIINKDPDLQKQRLEELITKVLGHNMVDIYSSPDIHILNEEEKNSIGIEEVKKLQQEMYFKPFEQKVQIAIIFNSQKLTHQAQNSLLKTLEESSDSTIYILCVDSEKNLLQTIISRSRLLYTKSFKYTESNKLETTDILKEDLVNQFKQIELLSKSKDECMNLINQLENQFKEELELLIKNGKIDSSKDIIAKINIVEDCRKKISANCNKRLVLEAMILQLGA